MENINLFSIKRCWGKLAFDYAHSASVGNSGGILCVWDPKSFSKLNVTISDYFVMVRGDWIPNGTKLLIISIYAHQDLIEKKILWDYLSHVIAQWAGEVVVIGDFNEVQKKDERFGSVFNVHEANAFDLFISNAGLEEVPLGGCSYTWCHKSASKMSKLDRFLISESLMNSCSNISAITLERFLSDLHPVLMRKSHYDYRPAPFRFFHYWFEIKGFDKFVEDSWKEAVVVEPNAMTKLIKKLKHLKENIRLWNKGNTMSSINRKRTLKSDLADLDWMIDKGCGDVEIIKWAIEGDENSKYYHGILNKKRSQLAIRGILVDGNLIDSPHLVKREFLSHFKNRFDHPQDSRLQLDLNFPNTLQPDQIIDLECDVSKDEIKRAVWDCGTDKSPGPDGFTFGFYRRYWNILESDVVDAVTSFFHHGQFPKGSNSSFIALIPKTRDANMVKDFRPISLIGSMYKIIAKILANRLVLVLGDLVNEVQSAFIADRQILDGPFILNEIVQWCQSKKKQSLVFKVDFEKAFDSVRWDYLDDILRRFGFGEKWCSWIQSCLRSSRGSVIVNGSPTEEFQFHKGLKQGDPLSPFLFILVMETLHISFQRIVDVGLRRNMSKSKLTGIYVEADKVAQAARKIGCVTLKTPFTYLDEDSFDRSSNEDSATYGIHSFTFFNGSGPLAKKPTLVKWTNVKVSYPSIWLDIVKEVDLLKKRGLNLFSFVNKKVGNGSVTLFWEETWHGDVTFKFLFPRAYALESCKNIDVASKLSQNSLAFTFRREPRGGMKQDQFDSLKAMMEGTSLVNIRDRWNWSLQSSGDFTVASIRKLIDEFTLSKVSSSTRWIKAVPIKVNVLAWKIKLDNLPTRLNISRRGMDIDSILCSTCCKAVESTRHIFFTCQIARDILHLITSW
ncbi:RNA-directed DNA polymerase, eukaryota [Tanacetum coccineum]